MKEKRFRTVRLMTGLFTAGIVVAGVTIDNLFLALGGVVTGMVILMVYRKKSKIKLDDEMTAEVAGKTGRAVYTIVTPSLALCSMAFLIWGKREPYLEALGVIFAYLSLLMIVVYSLIYRIFLKKYIK